MILYHCILAFQIYYVKNSNYVNIVSILFSIPASLESLLFNLGKLITQIFIVSMGTVTIASNAVSNSISSMINIPGNAFSIAATAIVGQLMGRRKFKEAENSLRYLVFFSSACLGIIGLSTAPFAKII